MHKPPKKKPSLAATNNQPGRATNRIGTKQLGRVGMPTRPKIMKK
jgi:hypothetical protein